MENHTAQRPGVRAKVTSFVLHNLWSHEIGSANGVLHHAFEVVDASTFHLGIRQIFGAAKVDELHIASRPDEHILSLQITVNNLSIAKILNHLYELSQVMPGEILFTSHVAD